MWYEDEVEAWFEIENARSETVKTEKQTYFEAEVVVAVNLLLMLVDGRRSLMMMVFAV